MSKWKLTTVLLGAGFAAAIVCIMAAAQLWVYVYPRAVFINAAGLFSISALSFLVIVMFLDDLSTWIRQIGSSILRGLYTLFFAVIFTALLVFGLYMGAAGGNALAPLSACAFENLDPICTKKQSELSDEELSKIKRPFSYDLTL